jgi:hypothetical protein
VMRRPSHYGRQLHPTLDGAREVSLILRAYERRASPGDTATLVTCSSGVAGFGRTKGQAARQAGLPYDCGRAQRPGLARYPVRATPVQMLIEYRLTVNVSD